MGTLRVIGSRIRKFLAAVLHGARTVSAILAILAVLGLSSAITGALSSVGTLLLFGVLVAISAVIGLIVTITVTSKLRAPRLQATESSIVPSRLFSDPLRLMLKEIVYQFHSDGTTSTQRKRFVVEALTDGLKSFPDRYAWTARNGTCTILSRTPGFTISNQHKEEFWDYFDVNFPHPLKRGEIVDFTVEWQLNDPDSSAVPFLSTMIDFPTDRLLMTVLIPVAFMPKDVQGHEFANYIHTLPTKTVPLTWNPASHSISYQVDHPRLEGKYLIRWYP